MNLDRWQPDSSRLFIGYAYAAQIENCQVNNLFKQAGIIESLLISFKQFSTSRPGDGKKIPSSLTSLLPESDSLKTESVYD